MYRVTHSRLLNLNLFLFSLSCNSCNFLLLSFLKIILKHQEISMACDDQKKCKSMNFTLRSNNK